MAGAGDAEGATTTGLGLETGGGLGSVEGEFTEPVVAQPDKKANAPKVRNKVCFIENCFSIRAMRQSAAHRLVLVGDNSKQLFGATVGDCVKKD